jgi:hypothetical protein
MFFPAQLSSQIKLLTWLSFAFMLGSLGILWTVYESVPARVANIIAVVGILDVLIILSMVIFGWRSRIKGYEMQPDKIVVLRSFNRKEIPLSTGSTARVEPAALQHALRKFGIGGFFSITGLFYSQAIGDFTAYVSDQQSLVVVKTAAKTFVISPSSPEEFVARFQRGEK